MPSEKLTSILRAKSDFSETQIAAMREPDGWAWVYQNRPAAKDELHQICFTGFRADEKAELVSSAEGSGWLKVAAGVTKGLAYLCYGENPGPEKIKKARESNVVMLSRAQFMDLLSHGELPTN